MKKVNITGLDKTSLFRKLYNHIQEQMHKGGNKEEISALTLKDNKAAFELLKTMSFDYNHLVYCNLKNDFVDCEIFDQLYGEGKFEEIVNTLLPPLPSLPEVFGPRRSGGEKNKNKEKEEKQNKEDQESASSGFGALPPAPLPSTSAFAARSGIPSFPEMLPPEFVGSGLGLGLGLGSSQVFYVPSPPLWPGLNIKNYDRCGKLKDGQKVYFLQESNTGVSQLNTVPGSCGFIALNTTRDAVLKLLCESKNPDVKKLISLQIESELLSNANDLLKKLDAVTFLTLKGLKSKVNQYQEELVALQAKLKEQYWVQTEPYRKAALRATPHIPHPTKPGEWSIIPDDFLKILGEFVATSDDQTLINQAISFGNALQQFKIVDAAFNEALRQPKVVSDYLDKCISKDWMGVNIALAWGIEAKRTLRVWKHEDVKSRSENIYLFENNSDALLKLDPKFKDPDPIDIIHTSSGFGKDENHFERLKRVEDPKQEKVEEYDVPFVPAPAVLFSLDREESKSSATLRHYTPFSLFPGSGP